MSSMNDTETGTSSYVIPDVNILYSCIGIFGLLGNAASLLLFHRLKTLLSNSTRILFMHQAFTDSLFSLFVAMQKLMVSYHHVSDLDPLRLDHTIYCFMWLRRPLFWSINLCSIYCTLTLTFDRYLALVHPHFYRHINAANNAASARHCMIYCLILILFSWLVGITSTFPNMYFYQVTELGKCTIFRNEYSFTYAICHFTIKLFLPILLFIYFDLAMFLKYNTYINAPDAPNMIDGGPPNLASQMTKSLRKRVLTLFALITGLYFVCYTPNQVFFLLVQLGYPLELGSPLQYATIALLHLNTALHPLVYYVTLPAFRKQFLSYLTCGTTNVVNPNPPAN